MEVSDSSSSSSDRHQEYVFVSFLVTPPLKNVRKRRFRKVARQKTQDHDEIEKEVRRLFRFVSSCSEREIMTSLSAV